MVKRFSLSCLILLLAAALDRAAWSQGPQPVRSPGAPTIASAGRMVGDKSRDTFLAAGDFFKKIRRVGREGKLAALLRAGEVLEEVRSILR